MATQKVTILGSEWKIITKRVSNADGQCCAGIKQIWISNDIDTIATSRNRVLRHEILHAFMFESGLGYNFHATDVIDVNETMVDWFAIQYPKIKQVFVELGIEN